MSFPTSIVFDPAVFLCSLYTDIENLESLVGTCVLSGGDLGVEGDVSAAKTGHKICLLSSLYTVTPGQSSSLGFVVKWSTLFALSAASRSGGKLAAVHTAGADAVAALSSPVLSSAYRNNTRSKITTSLVTGVDGTTYVCFTLNSTDVRFKSGEEILVTFLLYA